MVSYKNTKNANYLFIMNILKMLFEEGTITEGEFLHAKRYYMKLTGADIVLAN